MKKIVSITLLSVIFFCAFRGGDLKAQANQIQIPAIPYRITVVNTATSVWVSEDALRMSAAGKTNLFNNPNGQSFVHNAPLALFEPEGDFTLKAKVSGELKNIYDVAALVVYQDNELWAKLCYENSVEKIPTIVSVVTRKYSDDSNSVEASDHAYLAIVKKGKEFSFFYSPDSQNWKMIRHFHLDTTGKIKAGFAVHGSRGDGFTGVFSEIRYSPAALVDMRGL